MNEVLDFGKNISIIGGTDGPTAVFAAGIFSLTALILIAAAALLICFFGLKLARALITVVGLLIGAAIGMGVAGMTKAEDITVAIIILACAVVFAALAFFLYKFGVFCTAFCIVVGVAAAIAGAVGAPYNSIPVVVGILVVSLIVAVLSVIYVEPLLIILTAVSGGLAAGSAVVALLDVEAPAWVGCAAGVVLAIAGMAVQFAMHSRKLGKKEKERVHKVKEKSSVESEVEKAKLILEDDGADDE